MCGICGKLSFNNDRVDEKIIRDMMKVIEHRGPDDGGVYLSGSKQGLGPHIGLGHRRLRVIDLTNAGHQPMSNEDGSIWIVYNGEIYNFKELRKGLEEKGHRFNSQTDTEVIIHLYEERGTGCVKELCGMFAFAIWDALNQRLFLARDRLGQKPLNYLIKGEEVIFASEIKSILEDPKIERVVNIESLHNYLTYQYVPQPETMFEGIKKLPPAHTLVWEKGKTKVEKYWELQFSPKVKLAKDEYKERVLQLLSEATKMRLISDVPLGVFLSGGIDSSCITALMARLSSGPVKTFTIGFEERSFDELEFARYIAKIFGTKHHEFVVKPDALEMLPKLIWHFNEPFGDSSAIPVYYLSKLTRREVTVALAGDGGDEAFAGYDRYLANKFADYYKAVPNFIRKNINQIFFWFSESTEKKDFIRNFKRFSRAVELDSRKRYVFWSSIFDKRLKADLYTGQLKKELKSVDCENYLLQLYEQADTEDFIDATLYVDSMSYLPNDLLVKVDIASMANSLEVRSPFLDHRLVEFAAKVPSQLKLKSFTTKFILKEAFKAILPHKVLYRKKAGFGVPIGTWFKGKLKRYAYEILLDSAHIKRGYFEREAVKKLLDDHMSGRVDNAHRIWALLNLELWHRIFMDKAKI